MPDTDDLTATVAGLSAEPFLSLTTFRRNGRPVPTPVRAAADGDALLVWTGASSGKVKRLRADARVTVAPCDRQGRLLDEPVPATARVLQRAERARVTAALLAKYGWEFRLSLLGARLGRLVGVRRVGQVGLEIRPTRGAGSS